MLTTPAPTTDEVMPDALRPRTGTGGFDRRWLWAGGALSAVGAVLAAGAGEVPHDDGFVLCPFRRCSGGYCPGCGATRATGALLRGDVAGSVRLHPLVLLWAVQLALAGFWVASRPAGRRIADARSWWSRHLTALLAVNGVALVVVWLVRLGTDSIPGPFGWL